MIKTILNKKENSAEIFLFGDVGSQIDGEQVASEIRLLENEVELIKIKINSGGGSIISGFSIISAILNSKATIYTYNEGIAASMAGVILLTGDSVFMNDFAQIMLHEPSIWGETIDTTKDEKVKASLQALKDSLSMIITNRTGISKEEVDKILKDETWFNSKQAKRRGFIDEIVKTKKANIKSNMSTDEILNNVAAYYTNKFNNKQNPIKMELILNHLGLNSDDDEKNVLAKIKEIENSKNDLEDSVETEKQNIIALTEEKNTLEEVKNTLESEKNDLVEKNEILETKITEFENKEVELNKELAKNVVEDAIKSGKFEQKDKDSLVIKAEKDVNGFKELVNSIKAQPVNILNEIRNNVNIDDKKTIIDWQKEDPRGLKEMINSNPEEYKRLYKETYKIEPNIN